jgi:hypothetical protein
MVPAERHIINLYGSLSPIVRDHVMQKAEKLRIKKVRNMKVFSTNSAFWVRTNIRYIGAQELAVCGALTK